MIRPYTSSELVVEIPEVTEEERAAGIAANEQFKLNVAWWNARVNELSALHLGQYVCVAGQEIFAGDDPVEVTRRARAAHPDPGSGFLCFRIATHQGPRIHASPR